MRRVSAAGCWRTIRRCRCCNIRSTTCASLAAGPERMILHLPPFERTALLLDLDGTLLDIAPRPDAVVVPPGLTGHCCAMRQLLDDALAVVTGRPVETVDALLGSCCVCRGRRTWRRVATRARQCTGTSASAIASRRMDRGSGAAGCVSSWHAVRAQGARLCAALSRGARSSARHCTTRSRHMLADQRSLSCCRRTCCGKCGRAASTRARLSSA